MRKVDTPQQMGMEDSMAVILGPSSGAAAGRGEVGLSEHYETGAPVYQDSPCPPVREERCGFQDPQ